MKNWTLKAALLCALGACVMTPVHKVCAQPGVQTVHSVSSTDDNLWLSHWPPVDSIASINAHFATLAKTYKVKRVYWRGEHGRESIEQYYYRPQNPIFYEFYKVWGRSLHLTGLTGLDPVYESIDDLAVAAAKRNEMQVYMFGALFDHGASGDAGGVGEFPYGVEDKLRLEHPEWIPVDRRGERRQAGPIEFCYPAARKALVNRYVHYVTQRGYDGLLLYTYVENMALRYKDEFGYNEPIVKEFKRRHGIDIRTQSFDREAWYKLRGEYVTQFLSELHTTLKARGKKLAICLRCGNLHYPQVWNAMSKDGQRLDLPGAGMIYLDWERWIKAGLVDEVVIWNSAVDGPPDASAWKQVKSVAHGTPVEVNFYDSQPFDAKWKELTASGATALTMGGVVGYGMDRYSLETTTEESLKSEDWRTRAQAMLDITNGNLKVDTAKIIPVMMNDSNHLVRRQGLLALGTLKDYLYFVEARLTDTQHSARVAAVTALKSVNGPETPRKILQLIMWTPTFQAKLAAIDTLASMKERAIPDLLEGLRSPLEPVREVCVRTLNEIGDTRVRPQLLTLGARDPDWRVRYYVWKGLYGAAPIEELLHAMNDKEPAIQVEAARQMGVFASTMNAQQQGQALEALERFFRQFGDSCKRVDASWGWRTVGNAMLKFGPQGRVRLGAMRQQRRDKWLAWAAYLVLYVQRDARMPLPIDEATDAENYKKYAPPFPGNRYDNGKLVARQQP